MATKKSGYVWHMYHSQLLSYTQDYDWRVQDIKMCKPSWQILERLKRFQFVKGDLPIAFTDTLDASHISRLAVIHEKEIAALHKKECKNCSWNGLALDCDYMGRRKWYRRLWSWLRLKWYWRHNWNCPW